MDEAATRFQWRVHAYVVMNNHFHLAIELEEPNLSEGMKWMQGTWAMRRNRYSRQVGRPFQGRYKAILVEPGHAFGQVCDYIHLNPLRAGIVDAEQVCDYPWGSLGKWAALNRPQWLDGSTVLREAGGLPDNKAGWAKYVGYLIAFSAEGQKERDELFGKLSRGWSIGSEDFKSKLREEAVRRGVEIGRERFEGIEPEEIQKERELLWEKRLRQYAESVQINIERLGAKKSDINSRC